VRTSGKQSFLAKLSFKRLHNRPHKKYCFRGVFPYGKEKRTVIDKTVAILEGDIKIFLSLFSLMISE